MSKSKRLGYYYYPSKKGLGKIDKFLFDNQGYAAYKQGDRFYFHPVTVSQFALQNWDAWLTTQKKERLNDFIKHADLLIEKQRVTDEGFGVWFYEFDFPSANQKAPWISAMAQGQAMSVLLRAWQVTKDNKYLNAAEKALRSFNFSEKEGGVCSRKRDLVYYEEYPSVSKGKNILTSKKIIGDSIHTLNGFIFALFGLYDFFLIADSNEAKKLFDDGIRTLKDDLHSFDLGFASAYDQNIFKPKDITTVLFEESDKTLRVNKIIFLGLGFKRELNLFNNGDADYKLRTTPIFNLSCGRIVEENGIKFRKAKFVVVICKKPEKLSKIIISVMKENRSIPIFGFLRPDGLWRLYPSSSSVTEQIETFSFNLPEGLLTRRINPKYHFIHLVQLEALSKITPDKFFQKILKKWTSYNEIVSTMTIDPKKLRKVRMDNSFIDRVKKRIFEYCISSSSSREFIGELFIGIKIKLSKMKL